MYRLSQILFIFIALNFPAKGLLADILVATGTEIKKTADDGSGATTFVIGASYGMFWDTVNAKLYYTGSSDSIERVDVDGTNHTTLVAKAGNIVADLVVDLVNNKILWTTYSDGEIRRANLDGSGAEVLISGLSSPHGITIDSTNGFIYWVELGAVKRANVDGSGVTTIASQSGAGLIFIQIINGELYWSDNTNGKIYKSNLSGSSVTEVATGSTIAGVEGLHYNSNLANFFLLEHPLGQMELPK